MCSRDESLGSPVRTVGIELRRFPGVSASFGLVLPVLVQDMSRVTSFLGMIWGEVDVVDFSTALSWRLSQYLSSDALWR